MNDEREAGYMAGMRSVWAELLQSAASALGYDNPTSKAVVLIVEREATMVALREVCRDHGDNDWKDNAYPPDVVKKHLGCHLDAREPAPSADTVEALRRMAAACRKAEAVAEERREQYPMCSDAFVHRSGEADAWGQAAAMLEKEAEER